MAGRIGSIFACCDSKSSPPPQQSPPPADRGLQSRANSVQLSAIVIHRTEEPASAPPATQRIEDPVIPATQLAANSAPPPAISPPPAVPAAEEAGFNYRKQVESLTQLKAAFERSAASEELAAIFEQLDPDVKLLSYEFMCPEVQDRQELVQKGSAEFLKHPRYSYKLYHKIKDLLLFVRSKIPSLEERAEAIAGCYGPTLEVATLISKFAMERFDEEIFGTQQWQTCWGVTPVTFSQTLVELQGLVRQKLSGARPKTPVEKMSKIECANFLGGLAACRRENPEPPEELYECLNRRVRPQDKLLSGFSCVVTYIPEFVWKDNRILSVTARLLALDLGPNPAGERRPVERLQDPKDILDKHLTPEAANGTEDSCYFVLERDVAPNTKEKKPSVAIEMMTSQGDKGWQLPEPRNFFAAVFSRHAWKGEFLYNRQNNFTLTFGHGKARNGWVYAMGGLGDDGLCLYPRYYDDKSDRFMDCDGASGSRKFLPREKTLLEK